MKAYAFLGFTGGVGQLYSGMTQLVRAIEATGMTVKLWTWREGSRAADHHDLYDEDEPTIVLGHSRGAAAGWRMMQEIRKPVAAYFPIDYIPTNAASNAGSWFRHLVGSDNPPIRIPRRMAPVLVAFRQERFRWWSPETWPQGRKFVDEDGRPYERQYRINEYHTHIDNAPAVHQLILKEIAAINGKAPV